MKPVADVAPALISTDTPAAEVPQSPIIPNAAAKAEAFSWRRVITAVGLIIAPLGVILLALLALFVVALVVVAVLSALLGAPLGILDWIYKLGS